MARSRCALGAMTLLFAAQVLLAAGAAAQSADPAPDSPDAFRKFFGRLMNANRMPMGMESVEREVLLPDHERWFRQNFSEEKARAFIEHYATERPMLLERLRQDLNLVGSNLTSEVKVERWSKEKEGQAEGMDKELLGALTAPLWYFKLLRVPRSGGSADVVAVFIYAEGSFRYFPSDFFLPAQVTGTDKRLHVAWSVMRKRIIFQPRPMYPPEARYARIQGTVLLRVIIARDGSVAQLEVTSGPQPLAQAALDAVRRWRFQPTLLNGEPVEVVTTIDVTFTLSG